MSTAKQTSTRIIPTSLSTPSQRKWLSLTIATVAVLGVCFLGYKGIQIADNLPEGSTVDDRLKIIQYVTGSILPLLGTWMGTILAFYFARENFESASNHVDSIVHQVLSSTDKLKSISVTQAMRPLSQIVYDKSMSAKADNQILVMEMLTYIRANSAGDRLPILDTTNALRYLIHESTINDYLVQQASDKAMASFGAAQNNLTLDDLINKSTAEIKNKIMQGVAFISPSATLLEAHDLITRSPYCQNVFVTNTGKSSEPIMGWITNNKITELGKV